MARTIKVQALEIDGVELGFPEEVLLSVDNIASDLYGQEDLAAVLEYIRLNPDLSKAATFSHKRIVTEVLVPENQQMIVKGRITVDGRLRVVGQVVSL